MDSSSRSQLVVFVRVVFDDFSTKQCPQSTTREFPRKYLHYYCIRHQQAIRAKVIGFGHVMTPVVKVINSIRPNRNNPGYSRLLEELECGDLLQHTEIDVSAWGKEALWGVCHFWLKSRVHAKTRVRTPQCWRMLNGHLSMYF